MAEQVSLIQIAQFVIGFIAEVVIGLFGLRRLLR